MEDKVRFTKRFQELLKISEKPNPKMLINWLCKDVEEIFNKR